MHCALHVSGVSRADQPRCNGIVQNRGAIDQLVRGAPYGHAKSCFAGAACLHEFQSKSG
jgi:Zn-finger nucleic acid-binding protein